MKWIYVVLFFVIYFTGLFFLYFELPEKIIYEKGDVEFISCAVYDCANILVDLINDSYDSKCAFYDLDEPKIVSALETNDVRTLVFEENNDFNFTENVYSKALMHHKFCVFDDYLTLSGSWNPTIRGTYYNDNYILLFSSKEIANVFNEEFKRLEKNIHHGYKTTKINLSNNLVTLCFSPGNNCEEIFVKEINKAKKELNLLAFSFTSKDIANHIIKKSRENVSVNVVFEKTRISSYSAFNTLNGTNVSVFLDGNKYTMHEKMLIIDEDTSILGSYNPSKSANNKNDENLIIIQSKNLTSQIKSEFIRVLNQSVNTS